MPLMTRRFFLTGLTVAGFGSVWPACRGARAGWPPEISRFITNKEAQARALAKRLNLKVSSNIWKFFRAAQMGSTSDTTSRFARLRDNRFKEMDSNEHLVAGTPVFQPVIEVELAVEAFTKGEPKYGLACGNSIIRSIPPGSVYFGGTDPGRGLVTALCRSHENADPFFTITQNALTDLSYLAYLRVMYGDRIHTPTSNDLEMAFEGYLKSARQRLEHDRQFPNEPRQLKPGEDARLIGDRVEVSGQMSVIGVRGPMTKMLFDTNPAREFYVEESFPLDWMYPHLTPHGLIFKLNRASLPLLSEEVVKRDREFWRQQAGQLIGDWLRPDTSVEEVCAFVGRVFGRKDFSGFKGDLRFVCNEYTNKMFSKLRSSIAGLYQWRIARAGSSAERKRMEEEADFAFRQALAFCPGSPEAVFRYVNLLLSTDRGGDALRVARVAQSLRPKDGQLQSLAAQLQQPRHQ